MTLIVIWNFVLFDRPLISDFSIFLCKCFFYYLKMCYRNGIHEPTDSKDAMLLMFESKLLPHTALEKKVKANTAVNWQRTIHNANNGRTGEWVSERERKMRESKTEVRRFCQCACDSYSAVLWKMNNCQLVDGTQHNFCSAHFVWAMTWCSRGACVYDQKATVLITLMKNIRNVFIWSLKKFSTFPLIRLN